MFAPFQAKRATVHAARCRYAFNRRIVAGLTATTLLSACVPATTPLAGKDPADPTAKVAAVGYRPVLAPYDILRPVTPAPWSQRNDGGAPRPKSDQ